MTIRNLEIFTKMYHPYKIERLNNVFVFKTMDGDFAVKVNPSGFPLKESNIAKIIIKMPKT